LGFVVTLLAGCGGSGQAPVTAAGWTSDGQVVVVRDPFDDRVSGRVDVSSAQFHRPLATAVTDDGGLVISAMQDDTAGLYQCRITMCDTPARLAGGRFSSLNIRPDGTQLVAVQDGASEPVYLPLLP
jgi:hypothetical protein